jgi:hypothetical protein
MKLVLFQRDGDAGQHPGVLTERGVVDISVAVRSGHTPQLTMEGIIDDFARLRPALDRLAAQADPLQRALRDLHAVSAHIVAGWDMPALSYGQVLLGGPPADPFF